MRSLSRYLAGAAVSLLLAASSTSAAAGITRRDYEAHDYYAVHLRPGIRPQDVSDHLGLLYEGPLGELEDHHIFRSLERQDEYDHITTALDDLKLRRRKRDDSTPHLLDSILLTQKQELHKRFPLIKRAVPPPRPSPLFSRQLPNPDDPLLLEQKDIISALSIDDPTFPGQWHLFNYVDPEHDLNVTSVWLDGITGKNSTVCIVDDGLDMDSLDLADNYFAQGSYDFNDHVPAPKPRLSDDRHGTRCAGEVAAVRNDVCGVGVAYDAKVSGCRILSKVISNADEAVAMNYAFKQNWIYSCSWGPPDDGKSMDAPDVLIQRAMVTGVQKGRDGKGSIYVFAIGNGAANDDNCNFDGYTNSIYSVSVGGIDRRGLHPYYSEACSAQLVVAYSSGSGDAIHTTDVGRDTCFENHGGTSAAGPLVAGIYALALEANPDLTWRDIQYITIHSAVKVDALPHDWQMNKALGREFSHQWGYGKADAWALVELAKTWENVKPQAWFFGPWMHIHHAIPQGQRGLASSFVVTEEMMQDANLERLEHVTVTMNVRHTRRGDLSVELRSPSGMVSHIATHRRMDDARKGYDDWTFMSVAHWGEDGVGRWTVIVKDTNVNDHIGTLVDWRLKFYGEARDPATQGLLPLPNRHDDDDHNVVVPTQTADVATTSVEVPTQTGAPPGNPDDHQHRPVNSKISTATESSESMSTAPSSLAPAPTNTRPRPQPTPQRPPPPPEEQEEEATPTETGTNFLPHPFPTFGVSKRTQIWIYGALALILIFLAALGAWCIAVRRRKRRRRWDEYAFEMVDHEDHDDHDGAGGNRRSMREANGHANGGLGGAKGKGRKRAGELYDAFAEGSEDDEFPDDEGEEVMFEVGEDEDESGDEGEKRYRDDVPSGPRR